MTNYNPLCLCSQCQAEAFKRLAPAALGQEQYERELRMRKERKKLESWNVWAKGEKTA